MAFNLRKPIISIESKIDFKTLKTVKLQSAQQDGITTKKIEVPITDGGSFEGVLYTIREFNAVVTTLNYSTGDLLFTNFRLCLAGNAKEEWDNITQPAKKTVEAFNENIKAFKQVFMTSESKANLLEYIQEITKPKDMAVHTFVRRLQTLNRYAGEMPDDEKIPIFTEPQLKTFVFHAMPHGWQRTFIKGSKQLKSTSLQELIEYMDTQKNFADSHQESNKRRHEPSENHHDGRKHHHGNQKQKHRNKKFHGRQHDNAHSEKHTTRYSNDDSCPIHLTSKHTWGECYLNPHGKTFKGPNNSSSHTGGNGDAKNKNGAKKGHKNSNYQGPTHQTYFQSDDESAFEASSTTSTNRSGSPSSDSTPQHENGPGDAGRTQAVGRAHGRNDSRGASLTGYES
jgi:hypothetical protein